MGGMLTRPVTSKVSEQGEGQGLRYGLSTMQGWRCEMEDAHNAKIGLKYGLDDWSFFAVFDGHAGKRAAVFSAWNLLEYILRDSEFGLETGEWSGPVDINYRGEIPPQAVDASEESENSSNILSSETNGDESSSALDKLKILSDKQPSEKELPASSSSTEAPKTAKDATDAQNKSKSPDDDKVPKLKSKFFTLPFSTQLEMVEKAIRSGFLKIDQSMRTSDKDISGCTAICALISPTHIFIANCGDSRAILCDNYGTRFATEDHKPYKPKESRRIIDAGGTATLRINGTLAVSRALGDFEFKKNQSLGPCDQLVSPEPEVTVIARDPKHQCLILACDGIWDVMENYDVYAFVQYKLSIEPNVEEVCSSVLDLCLRKGSRDNMSIIIIVFDDGPKVCEDAIAKDKKLDEILIEVADRTLNEMVHRGEQLRFSDYWTHLKENLIPYNSELPPGGIETKYHLLRARYKRVVEERGEKTEENDDIEETD